VQQVFGDWEALIPFWNAQSRWEFLILYDAWPPKQPGARLQLESPRVAEDAMTHDVAVASNRESPVKG
jgi:hypothetical protein